jgi:hypothetical protein
VRVASLMTSKGTLIDAFRNPRDWPYLTMMGVTTELEIDMLSLGLFQMVGLMV